MRGLLTRWEQPFKFALVGAMNTGSSLLIYYFLLYLNINYIIATTAAYLCSSVLGFFVNKTWVFQVNKTRITSSIFKYYVIYGSSLVLNLGCMYLWIQLLSISKTIAPILTMCITIPYNYLFSKFWIFKESKKKGVTKE